LPRTTILENVMLPLIYTNVPEKERVKRATAALEAVGLSHRLQYSPGQLSGGEKQRAAIARALVNNPSVIFADEPTGNLDSLSSRVVMELLSEIHASGNTVLMVTHNPELTRYANRVIYMHDGVIIHDEKSAIGEVPKAIRRALYFAPTTTEEDDLAGVSALMQTIPDNLGITKNKHHKSKKHRRKRSHTK